MIQICICGIIIILLLFCFCCFGMGFYNMFHLKADSWNADYTQFLLKEHTIHTFSESSDIDQLENGAYVLTTKNSSLKELLAESGYTIEAESGVLYLWGITQ